MSLHEDAPASVTPATLEQRVADLEAVEAIRALKARYAALADQKYTPAYARVEAAEMQRVAILQAECFTEHAVWEGGSEFGSSIEGREGLAEWFNRSPWCFAVHYYGSPQIAVHGSRARGQWRLWQIALRDDTHEAVLLAAVTIEEYERQHDGAWLHSRMRFEQVHMLPVGDSPYPLLKSFASHEVRQPEEVPHA